MSKSTLFSLTDVPRPAATAQAARPHGAIEADRPLSTVWNGRSLQADPSRSERFEDRSIAAGTRLAGIGYRFLLAVASTLAGLGIGFHFADNATEPGQAKQQVASAEIDPIPQTLPTVHVSAQAPIPVLPTVLVRASEAERAAALADAPESRIANTSASGGSFPHAHLDMPYYSFGKVLPRISKE